MQTKEILVTGYEKVVQAELVPGVTSIIAVHNTNLGPSLGGCRFFDYHSFEDALTDALRLSEGMSYKSAMAGLPLGGGKAVIIGDPKKHKSPEIFQQFAEFVNSLEGKYITAKDVGIELEDLALIAKHTKLIRGTDAPGSSGDPSPMTAFGVYRGLQASAHYKWGDASLKNKKVIIQGLGHVGYDTAKYLNDEGATIYATEMNPEILNRAVNELGIKPLGLDDWQNTEADIFCPCAMGAILNKQTLPRLAANGIQIVAGGANNQLHKPQADGARLRKAKILYAPDYVINAGGIINIACEFGGYSVEKAKNKTTKIYDTLLEIYDRAENENRCTALVSLQIAKERLGIA
ncbi:MAG: Glu/Leu/Phe/Val dehydrogenase dimerization domain-containing protein [bacterium]|nr:amino acid dehydrogenase [bacterium]MBU1916596.1 amino acid dehydrogenase [bacterium]